MPVPEVLRHVSVKTLDRGLLHVGYASPAYRGQNDTLHEGGELDGINDTHDFGEKAGQDWSITLELHLRGGKTSGYLVLVLQLHILDQARRQVKSLTTCSCSVNGEPLRTHTKRSRE